MLMLGKGTKKTPIEKLSKRVLKVIYDSSEEELVKNLCAIDGMGKTKSLLIASALELGRRKFKHFKVRIQRPSDIIPYMRQYSLEQTERFITATVNGAGEIMNIRVVSVGTINKTLIHPREIFSEPVAEHASGIICCHNHPFGKCIPSEADRHSTIILQHAAEILGISLLDHLIITKDSYYSFLENGLLE